MTAAMVVTLTSRLTVSSGPTAGIHRGACGPVQASHWWTLALNMDQQDAAEAGYSHGTTWLHPVGALTMHTRTEDQ